MSYFRSRNKPLKTKVALMSLDGDSNQKRSDLSKPRYRKRSAPPRRPASSSSPLRHEVRSTPSKYIGATGQPSTTGFSSSLGVAKRSLPGGRSHASPSGAVQVGGFLSSKGAMNGGSGSSGSNSYTLKKVHRKNRIIGEASNQKAVKLSFEDDLRDAESSSFESKSIKDITSKRFLEESRLVCKVSDRL